VRYDKNDTGAPEINYATALYKLEEEPVYLVQSKKPNLKRQEIRILRRKYNDFEDFEEKALEIARTITGGRLEEAYKIASYDSKISKLQEALKEERERSFSVEKELEEVRSRLQKVQRELGTMRVKFKEEKENITGNREEAGYKKVIDKKEMERLLKKYPDARHNQHEIINLSQQVTNGDLEAAYKVFVFDNLCKRISELETMLKEKSGRPSLEEKEAKKWKDKAQGAQEARKIIRQVRTASYQAIGNEFIPADSIELTSCGDINKKAIPSDGTESAPSKEGVPGEAGAASGETKGTVKYWYGKVEGEIKDLDDLPEVTRPYQGQVEFINRPAGEGGIQKVSEEGDDE